MAHWPLLGGDSVGLARGLESNEKWFEMSWSASEWAWAGPLGLVSVISPWLYLTRGGLEPFVGRPSNLGQLSFHIERGDCHFMTRHEVFWNAATA